MNSATRTGSDDIFGGFIVDSEALAMMLAMEARRVRAKGYVGAAADYEQLAAAYAADAGEAALAADGLAARLAGIRAL